MLIQLCIYHLPKLNVTATFWPLLQHRESSDRKILVRTSKQTEAIQALALYKSSHWHSQITKCCLYGCSNSLDVITYVFPGRWLLCHSWQPLSQSGASHSCNRTTGTKERSARLMTVLSGPKEDIKTTCMGLFQEINLLWGLPAMDPLLVFTKPVQRPLFFSQGHSCMKAKTE